MPNGIEELQMADLVSMKRMSVANLLPGVPAVESPLFEQIFAEKQVSPATLELARQLRRDGFVVLDFPDPDFNQIADKIISALDKQYDWDGWRKGTIPNLRVQDACTNRFQADPI